MVDFEYKDHYNVNDFRKIIALLRSKDGCPWDREQTHESIRRNLLEEAYEVCGAIDEKDPEHLKEELGDLMLQVIFHSQMEEEAGRFNLNDVADASCRKLLLRHPHVFGDVIAEDSEEVIRNWDEIKRREKSQITITDAMSDVAESLPALWRAEKIQKKAKKANFDWPNISGALDKLSEELNELKEAISTLDNAKVEEELGDLLFAAVNVGRFSEIDPETALHKCCDKFIRRFRYMEDETIRLGLDMKGMVLEELEEIYQRSKELEKDTN
jgi:tetrapyrrole methylase family protein/MazG family protein